MVPSEKKYRIPCSFSKLYLFSCRNRSMTARKKTSVKAPKSQACTLGAFSISLTVKDLVASRAFYEALGFSIFGGDMAHHWLIMKNGDAVVGLFQGMFDKNMLTFNPGWDQNAQPTEKFQDVRKIQEELLSKGISLQYRVEEGTTGPASIIVLDPDGNPILIDQHR